MARKPNKLPDVAAPKPEVVPDGDWAGYSYDEVIALTGSAIDDAYAPLSIEGVCCVHDIKLAEILEVARDAKGDVFAYEAAVRFGQTLVPYLTMPQELKLSYRQLVKHRKGGASE